MRVKFTFNEEQTKDIIDLYKSKTDNRIENLQLIIGNHSNGIALKCYNCGSCNIGPTELK